MIRAFAAGDVDEGLAEVGIDIATLMRVSEEPYAVLQITHRGVVVIFCSDAAEAAAVAHDMSLDDTGPLPMRVPEAVAAELRAIAAGLH